ncbi:MAG: flagellar motor protein MotB [Lachnospiraceae bacterium]|nr:flagellar motor protein MotB [Lachnospiraceae bacterium]MBR1651491.1 flagellar motor protein MotB [Lachnospiraceae bacterium]
MGKKQEDPPAGSPAWMATFSDLMNLLLCFFVLLFSMSTIDEAKLNELIASMNSSFSIFSAGATSIGEGILISNGVSQLNDLAEYINSMGAAEDAETQSDNLQEYEATDSAVPSDATNPESLQEMSDKMEEMSLAENEQLAELISEAVADNNMSDQIDVSFTAQYVLLTMKGSLLFDSGSAGLKKESEQVLDKVAVILERYAGGEVEINGHTDTVPIKSAKYADNEELSSARALSVFYYLVNNSTLDSTKLKHAGMGERVPVADNSTEEGRAKNRRVEIRIYNSSK